MHRTPAHTFTRKMTADAWQSIYENYPEEMLGKVHADRFGATHGFFNETSPF